MISTIIYTSASLTNNPNSESKRMNDAQSNKLLNFDLDVDRTNYGVRVI